MKFITSASHVFLASLICQTVFAQPNEKLTREIFQELIEMVTPPKRQRRWLPG